MLRRVKGSHWRQPPSSCVLAKQRLLMPLSQAAPTTALTLKGIFCVPNQVSYLGKFSGELDYLGSLEKPDLLCRCYRPQSQVHYRQQVFFTTPMGLGPGSLCEFEDGTGLFHWVERDLLLTTINWDRSTWGKTRAHVKAEHTIIVPWHLCCSSRWAELPCSYFLAEHASTLPFQKKIASKEPEQVRHLAGFFFYKLACWSECHKGT